ncbi:MAG: hypothetical protein ABWY14_20685 [Tardiphaga sp.]
MAAQLSVSSSAKADDPVITSLEFFFATIEVTGARFRGYDNPAEARQDTRGHDNCGLAAWRTTRALQSSARASAG